MFYLVLFLLSFCFKSAYSQHIYYDTVRYELNNEIYSISKYIDFSLMRYEHFYINGEQSYSVVYHYERDSLKREDFLDEQGVVYAYGNYKFGSDSYQYYYYDVSGELLQLSSYSLEGVLNSRRWYGADREVVEERRYIYTDEGLLWKEVIEYREPEFNALGLWEADPNSEGVTYTYSVGGDTLSVTWYSISYYKADSIDYYDSGELSHSVINEWDSFGVCIKESYYLPNGVLSAKGIRGFNQKSYKTLYSIENYISDSRFDYYYDYRDLLYRVERYESDIFYGHTEYLRGENYLTDTALHFDSGGGLYSREVYRYYLPFLTLAEYLYENPDGDTLQLVSYYRDGTVSSSVSIKDYDRSVAHSLPFLYANGSLNFQLNSRVQDLLIICPRGRVVLSESGCFSGRRVSIANVGRGFYICRLLIDGYIYNFKLKI